MNLINYLPKFLRDFEEYKALFDSLDIEVQSMKDGVMYSVDQSSIMNCDEARVKEWESFLHIDAQGDLYQRKLFIVGTITAVGKLNRSKIEEIVNIYTGGAGATITFTNSTIKVEIRPPEEGEIFNFTDIERTLEKLKPAHLALLVTRQYSTYSAVAEEFATYTVIKSTFADYQGLKNHI